jgi:hypothetical protein
VDDFSNNQRNGNVKHQDTNRPDGHNGQRYRYDRYQFASSKKWNSYDRKKPKKTRSYELELLIQFLDGLSPSFQKLLENIAENQKRQAEVSELMAKTDGKMVTAIKNLAASLKSPAA